MYILISILNHKLFKLIFLSFFLHLLSRLSHWGAWHFSGWSNCWGDYQWWWNTHPAVWRCVWEHSCNIVVYWCLWVHVCVCETCAVMKRQCKAPKGQSSSCPLPYGPIAKLADSLTRPVIALVYQCSSQFITPGETHTLSVSGLTLHRLIRATQLWAVSSVYISVCVCVGRSAGCYWIKKLHFSAVWNMYRHFVFVVNLFHNFTGTS